VTAELLVVGDRQH